MLPRSPRLAALALGLVLFGSPAVSRAGAGADAALEERLRAMESQLQALAEELARLRANPAQDAGAAGPTSTAELEAKVDALVEEAEQRRASGGDGIVPPVGDGANGLGPAASKVYGIDRGVSIGGYGEMLYEGFSSRRDDGTPATSRDRLDHARAVLYTGYKFSDRILFNSELEVEHGTTGEGADERGEVSLEQAYLDFRFNDRAGLRAGLVLVPMGFINEIHEPNTFLGARRPEVERRVIPATWRDTGAGFFGRAGRVDYRAYVLTGLDSAGFTAGSGLRDGRQGGSRALAEDLAFVARLDVRATRWLTLGGSFYTGQADQDAKTPSGERIGAGVTLWEAHAQARYKGLDLRFLLAEGDVDDAGRINAANGFTGASSIGSRIEGWYGVVGHDVFAHRDTEQELIPFVRYEKFDTQAAVPSGFARDPANDRTILTLGLSYKPHPQVVVKFDWQDWDNEAGTGTDQVNLGVGYAF